VTVIAPGVTPTLAGLAETHEIVHYPRPYQSGDLAGAVLAIAATDDPAVQRAVAVEAAAERVLLNVVDVPALCTFVLPAVVRQRDLTVAISTGGASPALARKIREELAERFGPEYGVFAHILARLRERLPPSPERQRLFGQLVDSPALTWLRERRLADLDQLLARLVGGDCSLASLGVTLDVFFPARKAADGP
jgi:precorrin-2 dehydrogenase/sirohydrochlorin ferrochelatase